MLLANVLQRLQERHILDFMPVSIRSISPMSIHTQPINPVPAETARVARLAFPKGNRYMTMRDELGTIYTDQDFADLFSSYGQSAVHLGISP